MLLLLVNPPRNLNWNLVGILLLKMFYHLSWISFYCNFIITKYTFNLGVFSMGSMYTQHVAFLSIFVDNLFSGMHCQLIYLIEPSIFCCFQSHWLIICGNLCRWDIIAERLGFMLVFGDLVWIPFTFSIQACWIT